MARLRGDRTWLEMGFGAVLAVWTMIATPAQAQDEVKIGALMDVTGPIANFMPALLAAQQLAVDEVNANGGILGGKKLRLVNIATQGHEPRAGRGARNTASPPERPPTLRPRPP